MEDILFASLEGLGLIFSPKLFFFMMVGILIGMFFGLVPGLGGLTALGLLTPFAYTMAPEIAFAFLLGMLAVVTQTDTIPAILIGVPGTAQAQATVLDGYSMTKKGEAVRALSASYLASILGAVISVLIFALFLPLLQLITRKFAAPEFFMMSIMGILMAGSLAGRSVLRGIIVAGLGLLFSTIGFPPNSVEARYEFFGWAYLWDGLHIVPVILGLFAIPEVIDLMVRKTTISREDFRGKSGVMEGFKDCFRNWGMTLRCGTLGTICGMIPGLGGVVAEWFAYGHAVQTARDKSQFGKGDVRGIIAPESATGAQKAGSILPTVAFGIPGNPAMAVLLTVFLIVGLRPGPEMMNEKLPFLFMLVWTIVIANIIAAVLALILQKQLVKVCTLPSGIVGPVIFALMAVGSMMATKDFGDLVVYGFFGILGLLFKLGDWPRVPLIVGLVLGQLSETYLFITVERYGYTFLWERPLVQAIMIFILMPFCISIARRLKRRRTSGKGDRV
jgi:TctA family transporter